MAHKPLIINVVQIETAEVGFHPELTGRENIYLNGAILGMTRAEIGRKFDEIVSFAEVEKFLDTPVKRYSSGL
jgi:lipopolysaccharide transport system ATP-binding protein